MAKIELEVIAFEPSMAKIELEVIAFEPYFVLPPLIVIYWSLWPPMFFPVLGFPR